MTFQELEQYTIDDFDFDGVENDIPEITSEPETPVLDNIESVWTHVQSLTDERKFLFLFSL